MNISNANWDFNSIVSLCPINCIHILKKITCKPRNVFTFNSYKYIFGREEYNIQRILTIQNSKKEKHNLTFVVTILSVNHKARLR